MANRQNGTPGNEPDDSPLLILGIGASAGGLSAIGQLLGSLGTTSAAVVVVMHLAPDRRSHLTELLASRSRMPTVVATDDMPLEAGRVHVAPPGLELEVHGDRLWAGPRPADTAVPEPINRLFRSMAHTLGDRAIAVVLSGTGSDGAHGMRDVQHAGGLTLVQAPEEAEFGGMPRSAAALGGADRVLPVGEMAPAIERWITHWPLHPPETRRSEVDPFGAVVSYASATVGRDLRVYKPSTVRRRILRRMALLGIDRPEDYLLYMGSEAEEPHRLADQLLVEVTRFYRDPAAFAALEAQIDALPPGHREDGFRAWVAGCATGEEAYSLAILLAERFGDGGFRVFATDLSLSAISRARIGRYPAAALADVSPERRARWFVPDGDGFKVKGTLRHRVTFAHHDVIFDPPFSRIDVVSCRNLLIYLEPAAQLKVFQLLHFALRKPGLLFLGNAEAPPAHATSLFEALDRSHRIFGPRPGVEGLRPPVLALPAERWRSEVQLPSRPGVHHRSLVERLILERSVDAAALVDDTFTVLYTYGQIERYLRYPRGVATTGIGGALPSGTGARIRVAISAVLDGDAHRVTLDVPGHDGDWIRVRIIGAVDDGRVLLAFESPPPGEGPPVEGDAAVEAELQRFELELDQLVERLQTSNEDLRASHEELLSMNEELQSSNEELETSKEELQSLNEELTATNAQLQSKLAELEEANADLSNFVAASRIPALFLDAQLRIRRFTPETRRVFRLVPADVGRSLSDIRHELRDIDLDGVLHRVMEGGLSVEQEVRSTDGAWWRIRVMPYRMGEEETISGVMLTLVDITAQKLKAREAEAFRRRLRFALEGSPVTAATQDGDLRYLEVVNPIGGDPNVYLGASDDAIDLGPEGDGLRAFKRRVLATGEEARRTFRIQVPGGGLRSFDVRARRTPGPDPRLSVASIDITDSLAEQRRAQTDTERRVRQELSTSYLESLGLLAGGVAHDFNNHLMVMQGAVELLRDGVAADDADILVDFDRAMEASRKLIGQILAFVQSEGGSDEVVSVSEVIHRSVDLLRPIVPPHIRLELRTNDAPDRVRGTFSQLQQVATNLVHNAIQAMPDGGTVAVSVSLIGDQTRVELRVQDQGIGIPADRLGRVFEPFYTTRSRTKSSGMGLAVVHGVVRSMGGDIEVESEVGVGSVFVARFPLTGERPTPLPQAVARARVLGGGQRIAVVDDEDDVGRVIERVLTRRGFEVRRFLQGQALLDALEAGARFDAVVSDVLMPGLDGPSTLAAARRIVPDLPAVLVSGYRAGCTTQRGEREDPLLTKPVSGDQLVEVLLGALGQSAG